MEQTYHRFHPIIEISQKVNTNQFNKLRKGLSSSVNRFIVFKIANQLCIKREAWVGSYFKKFKQRSQLLRRNVVEMSKVPCLR